MPRTMSAADFKARCLDVLDWVAERRRESVVVTKRGMPVGQLVPTSSAPSTSGER
jgi:prevent-host-death family protein